MSRHKEKLNKERLGGPFTACNLAGASNQTQCGYCAFVFKEANVSGQLVQRLGKIVYGTAQSSLRVYMTLKNSSATFVKFPAAQRSALQLKFITE